MNPLQTLPWQARRPLLSLAILLGALAHPVHLNLHAAGFEKLVLTTNYYSDGITAGDLNRDGTPDIVAGPYWYEGPAFTQKHEFYPAKVFPTEPSPTDSMFSYIHDFNADGWNDILVLGRVHLHSAYWYENPHGKPGHWKKHFVFHRVQGESPPFLDVDGDGHPELVAMWENRWGLIQPNRKDPAAEWRFKPITAEGKFHHFYHGTGIGDINGDRRVDLILNEAWWEQPENPDALWAPHPFIFSHDKGGAQMFAYDVDGDSDNDVITALNAHGWGLSWFEQKRERGEITFTEHKFMGDRSEEEKFGVSFSQPHALDLADLDGDGLKDLVVGKRRWAHGPKGDVEPMADPVLYWFRLIRENGGARFEPRLVDRNSGVGVQLTVSDVTGDRQSDILTVSKLGAFAFINNLGKSRSSIFPGKNWEEASPESQGVDSARLEKVINDFAERIGKDGARELVIIRHGRMIWKGGDIDKVHGVWSFTKSFTSTVLALLIEDGKCTLESRATQFLPALMPHYGGVTLRHFTTMTSGYRAVGDEPHGSYLHGPSSTPFDPSPEPLFKPPGSQYAYWDSAMNQFGNVLTRIAQEPMEQLFKRRIADPIGMDPAKWTWGNFGPRDGLPVNGGSGNAGKHVQISAREAARFGLLFLNKGNWNGRQLLDPSWIHSAASVQVPADMPWAHPESEIDGRGVYGFNWWANGTKPNGQRKLPGAPPGAFWASGHNNNKCFVIPEWNMVIVRLGLDGKAHDEVWSGLLQGVGEAIRE